MGGAGVAGQSLLWRKAQEELDKAKQFTVQKNKRAALMCLKKKKMYETQADQVRGWVVGRRGGWHLRLRVVRDTSIHGPCTFRRRL
jgi:hypothetical protein